MTSSKFIRSEGETFAGQLRAAIHNSGLSNYKVWKLTGVDQATLSRFLSGERSITVSTADQICEGLNVSIRLSRRKK